MIRKINESFKERINKPLLISVTTFCLFLIVYFIFFKGIVIYKNTLEIHEYLSSPASGFNKNFIDRFLYQFHSGSIYAYKGHIFNILIFVPLGMLLSLFFSNKKTLVINSTGLCFLVSLFLEVFQLIFAIGCFEFLDLFTNTLGGLTGSLVVLFLNKYVSNMVINYSLCVIALIIIPFNIYAYIEVILNFDIFEICFSIDNFRNLFMLN